MLIRRYRLHSPRNIQEDIYDENISNNQIVVRPVIWSLCKADSRYYFGERDPKVLREKLPLGLIHEALGEVVFDPSLELKKGTKVVLIPNQSDPDVNYSNYLRNSKFYSSSVDGFMRELIIIDKSNVLNVNELITSNSNAEVLSMSELLSVSIHALRRVGIYQQSIENKIIGVWGDGVVGFLTALILKKNFPTCKLVVFGKHQENLMRFSFADEVVNVADNYNDLHSFDYCFECVGGTGSSLAINQIIELAKPCSKIALLGVSEHFVGINTRMVLEKGLEFIGCSRSELVDFVGVKEFFIKFPRVLHSLSSMITNRVNFVKLSDIHDAFMLDKSTVWGKTVIHV